MMGDPQKDESRRMASAAVRDTIVELARGQIGAHYIKGGAGNTPGNSDGAWYSQDRLVQMHENVTDEEPPVLYAASWTGTEKRYVCGGRSKQPDVAARSVGDPESTVQTSRPWYFKWERPDALLSSKSSVFGECCKGIRHFDCIGFVNWVLGHVQENHRDIPKWIAKSTAISSREVEAGDILTTGTHHIGIATGPSQVVHASDTHVGVVETKIADGSWDRFGRLPDSFWLRYGLTTEEIVCEALVVGSGPGE